MSQEINLLVLLYRIHFVVVKAQNIPGSLHNVLSQKNFL
ncbi:hypothetical protein SAMN05518672_10671 [Chitinophaga sp. CF118]|nr:hypothetical protein SAMN05518672_10671 [Chitinophaga sp. CF118]